MKSWEWMRIERGTDGRLSFFASPQGTPQTEFKAISGNAEEIVFENRSHDYPQRVRYLKAAGGIVAEIALADGSKVQRFEFTAMGGPAK